MAALTFSSALGASCSVYDESLLKAPGDAGTTPVACVAGTTGCIPSRPDASTSADTDALDITFALRDVLLEQYNPSAPMNSQLWRSIGFNLDGIDTPKPGDAMGCQPAPAADGGISEYYPVDGEEGIDNQFGAVIGSTLLPVVDPNLQKDLCCYQSVGRGTLMIRIRKWNGLPEDAQVTLSMTTALDGTSAALTDVMYSAAETGYVMTSGGAPAPVPSWVPDTDTWFTNPTDVSANDIDRPRHVDINGYVSGGYFVMALDVTQPIKLYLGSTGGITIGLRLATLIGHISANQHLIDDGWIGGRMGSAELLDASYRLQANSLYSSYAIGLRDGTGGGDPTDNLFACQGSAGTIGPLLNLFGDLLANGANDTTQPCDAVSAGVAFHGVRAKDVRVAPTALSIPLPDCDGQQPVFGTRTPDEATCPFSMSPATCPIPNWNSGL